VLSLVFFISENAKSKPCTFHRGKYR